MTLQSSGTIKFSEIEVEFGKNPGRTLGTYRVSETYGALTNRPLDAGIPQSGQISFSDFYSKRLNTIVNYHSANAQRAHARNRYINNTKKVNVVGGFRDRPTNSSGTKVFIHVNKKISSDKINTGNKSTDRYICALRTGEWDANTILSVDVGGSGKILGAGGDGGKGANSSSKSGEEGKAGNSALGLTYAGTTVNVFSGGIIRAGGGGGGGGGGAYDTDKWDDELASGGGGGGGAGSPPGSGGKGGDGWEADGFKGSKGTETSGGAGGAGGNQDGEAIGGTGGKGGDPGEDGGEGGRGHGEKRSSGGGKGEKGFWIVHNTSYNLNNSGTITGGSIQTNPK